MKANEAPEKIYLFENPISGTPDDRWLSKRSDDEDVEYVRKDAFIEEVCKYLQENCTYIHPRKGTPTCAVNLTLLKEYLEDKL